MSGAEQYARWVLEPENSYRTGRLIKLAAQRFLDDLKRTDIYFDESKAVECQVYCERYLCLWEDKWRGKPMDFRPWMRFIFEQIFGWIRVETGLRRFRRAYVQVAKKNAKSTLAGGLVNFHLLADQRITTPSIFIGANNEEQAKICLKISGKILENSPSMEDWLADGDVQLFYNYGEINKIVLHPDPGRDNREGTVTALSKESSDRKSKTAGGKHGKNPSLIIIDEHGMAADDNQLNDMESGQAARDEPFLLSITTAAFNMNGPCYTRMRAIGIAVLEKLMEDDSFLIVIHEMDPPIGEDGKPGPITVEYLLANENLWEQSNPNIDVSVSRQFLRDRLRKAKNERGSTEVDVMTLNFNRWCEAAEVWIPSETWAKNTHGINKEDLRGAVCFTGYDFAARVDICAVAAIFPNFTKRMLPVKLEDGTVEMRERPIHPLLVWFWMPQAKVKENKERVDYTAWVEQGLINTVPGDTIEWEYISDFIGQEMIKYQHSSGAYDPYLATNGAIQQLTRLGLTLNPIGQGFAAISEPTKEWELLLTSGQIEHFNNPVLTYMNKNTTIVRDNNRNIKIQKIDGEKGALKIDGIAAGINALAQFMSVPPDTDQLIESW
jgi:phage terminase large subunit-like protein